ncbi:MAG: helix-turn-helix domain-containing protein [Myxococcota bacterium]
MIEHESEQAARGAARGTTSPRSAPASTGAEAPEGPSVAVAGTFEDAPIGAYLRRQRVLRDVSLEELASMTRIPLRSLERLERGEFDGETDGFVRGFVRTVATALGLDVDDAVSRMLQEPAAGVWERHAGGRRAKQVLVLWGLAATVLVALLVLQAGWRMLVGASADDPSRQVVIWQDPVRALAEATGAEVDPAGEIDPARGSRVETPATAGR